MFEIEVGEVLSRIMVMLGDLFALSAVIASLLSVLGSLVNWRDLAARAGAAGLFALGFTIWAYFHKLTTPDLVDAANGFLFGFGNGLVGVLLALAGVLWIGGFALLVLRHLT